VSGQVNEGWYGVLSGSWGGGMRSGVGVDMGRRAKVCRELPTDGKRWKSSLDDLLADESSSRTEIERKKMKGEKTNICSRFMIVTFDITSKTTYREMRKIIIATPLLWTGVIECEAINYIWVSVQS